MRHAISRALLVTSAAWVVLTLPACMSRRLPSTEEVTAQPRTTPSAIDRIAQLGFGQDARFARCASLDCPQITPKTLARVSSDSIAALDGQSEPEFPTASASGARRAAAETALRAQQQQVVLQFGAGTATLSAQSRALLEQSVPVAKASRRIVISGRTDASGSAATNQQLAAARAGAVRAFLSTRVGDLPPLVSIDARGSCCFVADNDTPEGRQRNRRVEIVFDLKPDARPRPDRS